jgi:hypothetical protein
MAIVSSEDIINKRMIEVIKEYQEKRCERAISVPVAVEDLTVTRDKGLEVSGFVKFQSSNDEPHGAYIDYEHFSCSCMDNFVRKRICKHIIALVLEAYRRKEISMLEALSLLVWRI